MFEPGSNAATQQNQEKIPEDIQSKATASYQGSARPISCESHLMKAQLICLLASGFRINHKLITSNLCGFGAPQQHCSFSGGFRKHSDPRLSFQTASTPSGNSNSLTPGAPELLYLSPPQSPPGQRSIPIYVSCPEKERKFSQCYGVGCAGSFQFIQLEVEFRRAGACFVLQ